MRTMNSERKQVIMSNLVLLSDTYSNHHMGPSNIPKPRTMSMLHVLRFANALSLAYLVWFEED
jgi:hypothetical protein